MVLGLDISTSCIGICVMDMEGKLIELSHINMKKIGEDGDSEHRYIHKANKFKTVMEKLKDKYDQLDKSFKNGYYGIKTIYVEAPLANSPNRNTVNLLMEFNGICRYILYQVFGKIPVKVSEHDARATFLPEFCRMDTERTPNPEVFSFITKMGVEFPGKMRTFDSKFRFLMKKYPTAVLKPYVLSPKRVFSYPKSVIIKEHIYNKMCSIEGDSIKPIYKKNGLLDSCNYDMSDAYVIAMCGVVYETKK